jgi:hypothetical protein
MHERVLSLYSTFGLFHPQKMLGKAIKVLVVATPIVLWLALVTTRLGMLGVLLSRADTWNEVNYKNQTWACTHTNEVNGTSCSHPVAGLW